MKKIKLETIDIACSIDERILNDWRYMDYLTQSEDPALSGVERFRAINKSMELLLGMELKEKILYKIAERDDGHVSYKAVFKILKEIGDLLGKQSKK